MFTKNHSCIKPTRLFLGEEQPWSKPPKDIKLIQKADPLARRPYKSVLQQPIHSEKTDGEKTIYGAIHDANDDVINKAVQRLSRKLDDEIDNQ
ncbi:hypothetical protein KUTeg_022627 [Tegillarca granosa]|uniref:Uncharacterized protein n=1 Tax=Tegillarca granosa TaxID=220873 RepID=A0ABQ9DZX2_TEGGR|nr:hypothetical protein KUTeg_022627 [Tegillarca granosa]